MRIATWNVNRPSVNGWKIPPGQLGLMGTVQADLWVLTETHVDHRPTPEHVHIACSPPDPERRRSHERWTAIWSRWPVTPLADPAPHRRGTVPALVDVPRGPLLVYGTVIAWANEPHFDDGSPARLWDVHMAEIERQGVEWQQLRNAHPDVPLVVAGDFNQSRDGSRWYGTRRGREALGAALQAADLVCLTDMDVVATGRLARHHLVDHICVSRDLAVGAEVECREPVSPGGSILSDHPIVAVDLAVTGS